MNLVIVESPTKAKTISKFLGGDFVVESSYGHVRDLPQKKLGIDVEKDFEPEYTILPKAKKRISELKAAVKKSKKVILATDEDREGEAISWHLIQALGLEKPKSQITNHKQTPSSPASRDLAKSDKLQMPKVERIVFHEITKSAIEKALQHPRNIDEHLVDAQQTRRILDRLVGYELSPFLWKKVARGLSAGRVQSVAVRLIVEREREVLNFKPETYFTISALLKNSHPIETRLVKIENKTVGKFDIKTKEEADDIVSELKKSDFIVEKITAKEVRRSPLPPFTTSTMQQAAFQRFRWSAKQTMMIAQQLYEGVEIGEEGPTGLITYMRTDSVNISVEALEAAKIKILSEFGKSYALDSTRVFKTKSKSAQEAHEAVRPADPGRDPESLKKYLEPRQFKLYDLIWRRFMASQMPETIVASTSIDIKADKYTLRASGSQLKFDGFLRVYPLKMEEILLPDLKENQKLLLEKAEALEHQTEPPARYNEATLIKTLEEFGIGRPSTYAPIMSTIQIRRYVEKDEQKRFRPTDIGILVNDILTEHFPKIVDIQFTARMEEDLDRIAEGKQEWIPVVKEFWIPFKENLDKKTKELSKKEVTTEKTDLKCPQCGKELVIRMGRFGRFYACTGFPDCKYTAPLEKKEAEKLGPCPKCLASPDPAKRDNPGQIVKRRTKKGRFFYGCSRWPDCDFASWKKPHETEVEEEK